MKIEHIGIAVKSIDNSLNVWQKVLGLELFAIKDVPEQKVKVAILKSDNAHIELLEPVNNESPVYKFLEKKGEGIHHICFEVDNIEKVLAEMKDKGIKLIDEVPIQGAYASKIAFVHPKDMNGVLIELCEK